MSGRRIADRYVLAEQLGAGGMGVVVRAFDERLGRAVAVKLLHAAAVRDGVARERLIREARAVAVLEHPGIVHVYDVGATDDGAAFLVMELVRGKSVRELLETSSPSLHERLRIVIDAARALAFAHSQGFVHRDIKPDNIMVRDDGRVVVLDFGLAKLFDTPAAASVERLTEEGAFVGTPAYLAPEQARRGAITSAADQFALAVVAYEIVTGALPWSGASALEVIAGILRDDPGPASRLVPTLPRELDVVLARALAKQATDRFPTIDAFADALATLASTASTSSMDARVIPPMESAQDSALAATVYSTDGAVAAASDPVSRDLPTGTGVRTLLVGRARELAEIDAAIADLFAHRGSVLSFAGEPGIGKTRLAEEAVARARSRGARSGWGRCWEGAGAPPYWAWTEALRALGQTIAESPRETDGDDDAARFRVLEGIVRAVQAAGAEPVVIVLDDLHWADRGSVLALKLVARSIQRFPVLVIVTYRDVEARLAPELAGFLSDVGREGRTVPVRGLTESDVAELARSRTIDLAAPEMARLHRATNGNPFFVGEVLGLAVADPSTLLGDRPGQSFPLSDGVREVIRRRVALLPALVRSALPAMVVVGHDASLRLVAEISGQDAALLAAALAAPVVRDLVVTKQGRIGFAHDLAREALYESIEPEERVRLHRAAAAALEAQRGDEALAEIAEHLMAADPMALDVRAVEYTERAGHQAARRWASDLAARHFARAVAAREERGETKDHAFAELLVALADAYIDATLAIEGRAAALRAFQLAQAIGAPVLAARATLAFGRPRTFGIVDPAFLKMLETAIAGLGTEEPALRCRLRARLAGAMQPGPDPEAAVALARASIAEARLLEPEVLLAVLEASRLAYRNLDDIDERLAIVEEMCSLADRLEHRAHALEGRFSLLHIHFERGDRRAANERADEYRALVRAFPMPVHVGNAALVDSTFASIDGKFAEADAICATVPTGPTVSAFVPAVPHRGAISRAWGSPEALERSFASVSAAREPIRSAILAALHVSMGNREGARAALESVVMHIGPDGLSERTPYIGRLVLADAAVFLEDVPRARILYELLLPMAERHAVWVPSCVYEGSIQHRVGQLASVLGRSDEAVARLEAAIVANASMGSRPWVARAEDACASALRKRGRPADVARAETLERSALATYESLGMTTHTEALRKRMAGAPPEPARDEPAVSSRGLEPKLVMEQTGDRWTISYGDDAAQLKDADGLHYLAALVARPEVDVHVLDLLAVRGRTGVETGDAGPALDARAKAAYKERLEDLADRLEEAERFGDTGKAERAEAEMAAIKDELARAVGLGGRDRKTGASAERARVNVTLRIKKAVEKIDAASPGLGHHLKTCVKTGVFCVYRPPPRAK